MMKNIKWRILVITCLICLLPVLLGLAFWNELPESVAIHFNFRNEPDHASSKSFAVFGLPLLMAFLQAVCCLIHDLNIKKHGEIKRVSTITKWILPVVTVLLQVALLIYNLGYQFAVHRLAFLIIGGIFLVLGNYLPKYGYIKNYDLSAEKARKVNRFVGYLTVIMGILALVAMFLPPAISFIWMVLLIPYTVISIVYRMKVTRR